MYRSTPQVPVEEEGEPANVKPRFIRIQDPVLAGLISDDGMPARHSCYPLATPSQNSFDPSTPFTRSVGATSLTTPNDPSQDSGLPSPAFDAADTFQGDMDIRKYLEGTGSLFPLIPNFPPTLEDQEFTENEPDDSLAPSQNDTAPAVTHSDTEEMNKLRQAVVDLFETCMSMDSSMTECPRTQLLQMQEQLPEIKKHISSMVHQQTSTDTVVLARDQQPPGAPNDSKFKCFLCLEDGKTANKLDLIGIRRHINDVHYPKFEYPCAEIGCRFVNVRRDRLSEHINKDHHRRPNPGELDKQKKHIPFEHFCHHCSQTVHSWREFIDCFISHCPIGDPSNAYSPRRPSVHGAEDTGGDDDDDQSQLSPAREHPRSLQRGDNDVGNTAQQFQPGSHANAGQYFPTAAPNHLPGQQPLPNNQLGGMPAPPLPRPSAGSGRHLTRGDGYRANPPFARPSRFPIPDPRNRVVRPADRQRRSRECGVCGHPFSSCRMCRNRTNTRTNTAGGCHVCLDGSRIRADTNTPSRRDASSPTSAPRMNNRNTASHNVFGGPGQAFDLNAHNALGQGPFDWGAQRYYHDQGNPFNNFGQMGADPVGGLWTPPRGGNNVRSRMVLSVDDDVLTEQEIEYSSVLDFKALQPMGILTSILPLIDPVKKWLFTPLKSLSTMALSGLDLITETEEAPSAVINSDSASECQCRCKCRTRTELAPDQRMEMSLELTPADPSESTETQEPNSHHLRTRVQIVVKLLKLRSSVANSNRQEEAKLILEQAFAPTLGETVPSTPDHDSEDSETSDTESVFSEDDLSISSSCSDLQSLSLADNPSTDDVVDVSDLVKEKGRREDDVTVMFDFDLHSALGKLSKWSGGSSDSICSDLSISDPGRVMGYLTAYVLYVIMALGRSGEHASGRRLSP